MNNLAQTKDALAALAQQFRSYNYKSLNESQVRKSYIDEFWNILGWNTADIRQVQVETRDKNNKKPDYRFLVQNKTAFFVEAKKPSEDLMKNSEHIFQAKSYCWSGNVPLVVLTDFEEFRPFKCVNQPDKNKPKDGIIKQLDMTFEQYPDRAEELLLHFGYESVVGGSLAQLLQLAKVKDQDRVDRVFLKQLAEWRKVLAEKAALVNTFHSSNELAEAVQRILDRLVFLRILQDRSIEDQNHLRTIADTKKHAYKTFVELCQTFSHTYNGLIFNAHPLSESITIHDLDFKPIVQELLPDESPYRFDEIPVEVLGTIYERFLGDEIILQGRSAIVETKPDVRKAGGVYYTPQYIVEYIVNNTVGALLAQCNNPKEVAALTICDPACGSGSFLLGAFDALIAWHEQYFEQHPDEWKEKSGKSFIELAFRDSYNKVRLTAEQKGRIAKNNLFGVDLDRQATEVTQMSLYIKILETIAEEPSITISYRNAILPKLSDNIKHGNSLVDVDYYDMFPEEQHNTIQSQIRPFNWKHSFPAIFKKGGFDAVIGNPPWVDLKGHPQEFVKYYFNKYRTTENRINLYSIFVELGLRIMSNNGIFGYIIPNSILYQSSYEKIRVEILNNYKIKTIVRLPDGVFQNVKAETIVLSIDKKSEKMDCIIYDRNDVINEITPKNYREIKRIKTKEWILNEFSVFDIFSSDKEKKLLSKIENGKTELQVLCDFTLGLTPYDKYKGHTQEQIKNRVFHSDKKINKTFKPLLEGADVRPYYVKWGGNEYISYGSWLGAPREERFFKSPRVLVRQIVSGSPLRIYAGYTDEELYNTQSVFNIVSKDESILNIKYLLALLNSKLMNFYHGYKYLDLSKNLFQKILIQNCKKFPIKTISNKTKKDFQTHNEIINLVQTMLDLHKTKEGASGEKLEQIQARISHTDDKINRLVYELYELTDEEIRIVEGV